MKHHEALLVTTRDAADMLGISRASLYRLLKSRRLKSIQLPGTRCRRIPVEELKELVRRSPEE